MHLHRLLQTIPGFLIHVMQLHAITHSLSLELIECSAQDDLYGARLGSLLIRGPRFVPQDLNCSVGLPCVFGPLDGTALARIVSRKRRALERCAGGCLCESITPTELMDDD